MFYIQISSTTIQKLELYICCITKPLMSIYYGITNNVTIVPLRCYSCTLGGYDSNIFHLSTILAFFILKLTEHRYIMKKTKALCSAHTTASFIFARI